MLRRVAIPYRPFGTSVRNHHCTLRNSLEKRIYHLNRGGSLKSVCVFITIVDIVGGTEAEGV